MASDDNTYSPNRHESVDLGRQLDQPRIEGAKPDGASDLPDATSQSPLAQLRGTADPIDIGPGSVKMGMR